MDRSKWMFKIAHSEEAYVKGVLSFLEIAEANRVKNGNLEIWCPCKDCKFFDKFSDIGVIENHLITCGFLLNYTRWSRHGELQVNSRKRIRVSNENDNNDSYNNNDSACHHTSLVEWNWNMVKCPQQEGTWECGYYVGIAMFELFFQKQSNFPDNKKDTSRSMTVKNAATAVKERSEELNVEVVMIKLKSLKITDVINHEKKNKKKINKNNGTKIDKSMIRKTLKVVANKLKKDAVKKDFDDVEGNKKE
ncbi:transposon protein [Tanacetum coccineum]